MFSRLLSWTPLVLIVGVLVCGIITARLSSGSRKAAFRLCATVLVGGLFVYIGLLDIVRLRHLPRLAADGIVQDVHRFGGKNSHTRLRLEQDGGEINLKMDYTGSNVQSGQTVRVSYVAYRGTVTSYEVLKGPAAGWVHTEGDGTVGDSFSCAVGLFIIASAFAQRKLHPDGEAPRRLREQAPRADTQDLPSQLNPPAT